MPQVIPPTGLHSGLVKSRTISLRQVESQGWLQPRLPRATVLSGSRGVGRYSWVNTGARRLTWPLPFSSMQRVERDALLS